MRTAVLQKQSLLFSRPEQNNILEELPLHEISKVVKVLEEPLEDMDMVRKLSANSSNAGEQENLREGQRERGLDRTTVFEIRTEVQGCMDGKKILMRCDDHQECTQWVQLLKHHSRYAKREREREIAGTKFRMLQRKVKDVYDAQWCQGLVAVLILISFILNIANAEIVPDEGTATFDFFENADMALTLIFLVELLINYFANAFMAFWEDGWNIFDFIVVTISLLALIMGGSGGINLLRLLRVFRVVRLFRRFRRLKQIINALIASLAPVMSSFMVLALVTSIYAVLAVNLLADKDPYHFGYFSTAFFSMAQICIGWAEEEIRPVFEPESGPDPYIGLFFLSYILFAGVVLINIVVAVLLDEFITSVAAERAEFDREQKEQQQTTVFRDRGPLDPVLDTIAHYGTAEDLTARIEALFQSLDVDESGKLSFREMWRGLQKLNFRPRIELTLDDFEALTDGGELCNDKGELGSTQFEEMIRRQLQRYSQRNLAYALDENEQDQCQGSMKSMMLVLKQLGNSVELISQEQQMVRRLLMRQHGMTLDSITPKHQNGSFKQAWGANGSGHGLSHMNGNGSCNVHSNGNGNGMASPLAGGSKRCSLKRTPEEAMGAELKDRAHVLGKDAKSSLNGDRKKQMGGNGIRNGHTSSPTNSKRGSVGPTLFSPVETRPNLPNQPVPSTPFQAFKPVKDSRTSSANPLMNGNGRKHSEENGFASPDEDERRISMESVSDAGSPPPL